MKILVIGGGGREHALVWKIAQSQRLAKLFCAPGSDAIASLAERVPIAVDDIAELLSFAKTQQIDLTVVGPELPLSLGIVDRFEAEGLRIFGASRAASEIETSKVFSKHLMEKYQIPTAKAEVISRESAYERIASPKFPMVLKVDGLAAGKGVVVAHNRDEAVAGLDFFGKMGEAASRIIIEQYLEGLEISFFVVTDGVNAIPIGTAQDHKPVFDGDRGPNTGGMGTFSPSPKLTSSLETEIMSKIIMPTLQGLAKEGRPYRGILYAGLILTAEGIYVLEFNARWGDPEAQVILPRMKTDWVDVMDATLNGRLDQVSIEWEEGAAVCVVLASGGYPGAYQKGGLISGIEEVEQKNILLFHAGTEQKGEKWQTCGGRVLGVTATGPTIQKARTTAYQAVKQVSFAGMHYRTDIGTSPA